MEKKKTTKKKMEEKTEARSSCDDIFCPIHGQRKLKVRGRVFDGIVVKKLPKRVSIEFERMLKLAKYERYEKRKTRIHARLPDCMSDEVQVGDRIQVAETRPTSKTIHFVVLKVIGGSEKK
jgi:small subunit ribosomal protein S17